MYQHEPIRCFPTIRTAPPSFTRVPPHLVKVDPPNPVGVGNHGKMWRKARESPKPTQQGIVLRFNSHNSSVKTTIWFRTFIKCEKGILIKFGKGYFWNLFLFIIWSPHKLYTFSDSSKLNLPLHNAQTFPHLVLRSRPHHIQWQEGYCPTNPSNSSHDEQFDFQSPDGNSGGPRSCPSRDT